MFVKNRKGIAAFVSISLLLVVSVLVFMYNKVDSSWLYYTTGSCSNVYYLLCACTP